MLKEITPRMQIAALVANPTTSPYDYFLGAARAAAASLALEMLPSPIESSAKDIERVFADLGGRSNIGLLVTPDNTTIQHRDLVISTGCILRRPHFTWRQTCGASGAGTDQISNVGQR